MSLPIIIFILVILAIIVGIAAFPTARASVQSWVSRIIAPFRAPFGRPQQPDTVTVIQGNEEFEAPIRPRAAVRKGQIAQDDHGGKAGSVSTLGSRLSLQNLLIGVVTIAVVIVLFQLLRSASSPADKFVVLIAPFRDPNGSVSQTGRVVAQQLADLLPAASENRVLAQVVSDSPAKTDFAAVLDLMDRQNADVMVWGNIASGGLLNQESLQPMLAYHPTGAFAPNTWDRYKGRFAIPTIYELSSTPINGQIVLPNLLTALSDYGNGEFDLALKALDTLMKDYPALDPTLPSLVRGNILWARGEYHQAADEYRRTGVMEMPLTQNAPMALLANDLGAILQDAADPTARATFERAGQLLGKQDLLELRYNWGIEELRAGQTNEAIKSIEQVRNLLPSTAQPPTAMLITLAGAYRTVGRLGDAERTLDTAERQIDAEVNQATANQHALVKSQLRAALLEERGLLQLARAINARGPLLWEVQANHPLTDPKTTIDTLKSSADFLDQSIRETDQLKQDWGRLSTAEDAASKPINGLVAIGQAQDAEKQERERQRSYAATEIELGRIQGVQPAGILSRIWTSLIGDRTPVGQARSQLETLVKTQPDDVDSALLLGHALLVSNQVQAADDRFKQIAAAAPKRPEPLYGQALIALPNDRAHARQLLLQSIALDQTFFPAREQLAQMAEEDKDWPTALEQRHWLAQNHPSDAATLALARTLRLSGTSGYAEAGQLLLPLAKQNQVPALLELSQLYRSIGNDSAAVTALERAHQVDSRNPEVAYALGNVYTARGDMTKAEAQYQLALDVRPQYIEAHLALARLYEATNRRILAAREYRAALNAGASDLSALKQIGTVLLENGQYDPAITAFERARTVNDQDAEVRHGLARAYMGAGRFDAAQVEEQKALDLRGGKYPEAQVGLGNLALHRGDIKAATDQFNAALQQNAQLPDVYLGLGQAAAAQGNWSVAQGYFNKAVSLRSDSPEAYLWLGEALIRGERPDEAITAYKQALQLRNEYPEAYFGLAQAQATKNQLDDARVNLKKALALRPNYAEALLLQGKIDERQEQIPEAIDSYSQSINANNKLAEPLYRRALLYIQTNRLSDAQRDLEQAVRVQPNFPEAHYWLGRSYLAQGQPDKARDQFGQAAEQRGGNYPEARFYEGLTEEQLGQRDNAIASLKAALQQDGASPWASEAQAALARLGQ